MQFCYTVKSCGRQIGNCKIVRLIVLGGNAQAAAIPDSIILVLSVQNKLLKQAVFTGSHGYYTKSTELRLMIRVDSVLYSVMAISEINLRITSS